MNRFQWRTSSPAWKRGVEEVGLLAVLCAIVAGCLWVAC